MAYSPRAIKRALRTTQIGGKPVSYAAWQRGDLAKALLAGSKNYQRQQQARALPSQGSYNPDLDAAERAATRGLGQLRQDTELGLARAGQDYTFGREDLNRGLSRGEEDYRTNTQALQRSFNILAGRQQENANAAGVLRGGAMLQAAAKRKENQGIQQGGLDTSIGRLRQDTQTGLGRLDVGYNRQVSDFGTAQQRATDENTFYGQDIAAQRFFQASQPGSGWTPPKPKKPRR